MRKNYEKLLYSNKMADKAAHVFIDGDCIKSRGRKLDGTFTIEDALKTGRTVLVQEGVKVTIHSESDYFSYYKRLISYDISIRQAFIEGKLFVLQNPNQPKEDLVKLPMGMRGE